MSKFFQQFFVERGEHVEPNPQGEVMVRCPFPHSKGYDTKPSSSFNVKRNIFKCFTCSAEGREHGMSETSFIAKLFDTSYDNALRIKNLIEKSGIHNFEEATKSLLNSEEYVNYLQNRGITQHTIKEYKLGYNGFGIIYPVLLNNMVADIRIYNIKPQGNEPKIKSNIGAKPLLFPYDAWISDEKPTVLCAGENDTLLARQYGFNAVTVTAGEGSVPKLLLNKFKGKKVYICYDCDEAGQKSSHRIAYYLKEVGAEVYLVDLGLTGTKDDKDITDFFVHNGKQPYDLQELINNAPVFTDVEYLEQKNKEYELVNLWEIKNPKYSNQYISSRVLQTGHFNIPQVDVPMYVEWECKGADDKCSTCENCFKRNKSGHWSLENDNLEDLLYLVEVKAHIQEGAVRYLCGLPDKCPNAKVHVVSKQSVDKVILSPDVESEDGNTYKDASLNAYVIGGSTEDGNRYRMYFKRVPHLKDQSLILIVDKVEESDNAINTFRVTEQFKESMKKWQGNPFEIMEKRYEELGKTVVGNYLPKMIFWTADIIYHGILDMKFMGQYIKGHPEGLLVGASRTGKSEVGEKLAEWYGLGNITECKSASLAGLIGGVTQSSNGGYRIDWGQIPRNHKGLLMLDEVSGLPNDVFRHITGVRSQRRVVIEKIAKGRVPAKTRLLWVGNPQVSANKRSKSLYDYASGVDVCLDLFPADEDVSRFDFIVLVPEPMEYISPLDENGNVPDKHGLPDELRELIRYVWSRNQDQVKFDTHVERYIEHIAMELNVDFGSAVKIIGIEGTKKIARIATSVAACCFSSTDDGETILVKKEHVDWTKQFLMNCYDNNVFNLKEYVKRERALSTTNDEINTMVAKMLKNKNHKLAIVALIEQGEVTRDGLMAASGMDRSEYNQFSSYMNQNGLIKMTKYGVEPTRRLRLSISEVRMQKKTKEEVILAKPRSYSEKIQLD